MKAKFQLSELLGVGMTLVVLGIGLAYGLQVMGDIKDNSSMADCTNQPPTNASYTTYISDNLSCQRTGDVEDLIAPKSASWNASGNAIEGVAKIPNKLPTIATVIVAAVILGILVTYLWARFR